MGERVWKRKPLCAAMPEAENVRRVAGVPGGGRNFIDNAAPLGVVF